MSFTPAVAETLRQALATVVVVPVTPLQADVKDEIRVILTGWGLV
jgi:hypothetical protein